MKFLLLLLPCFAFASYVKPNVKSSSGATLSSKWNLSVPFQQGTDLGRIDARLETGSANMLANPSFEASSVASGWTVAGSVVAAAETTGFVDGAQGASLALTSVNGSVISQNFSLSGGLSGAYEGVNLEATLYIESTAANLSLCIMRDAVEYACAAVPSSTGSNQLIPVTLNMPGPNNGTSTVGIKLKTTTSTSATIFVDYAYLGVARNVSQNAAIVGSTAWTPVFAGYTAAAQPTNLKCYYRQVADHAMAHCDGTHPSVAASTWSITTPFTINSAVLTSQTNASRVGLINGITGTVSLRYSGTGDGPFILFYDGSDTTHLYVATGTSSDKYAKQVSSTAFGTSTNFSLDFDIPIIGTNTLPSVNTSVAQALWSGYHDSTCSWARTNASYGDPTADASCALVQTQNINFGTVVTANSAGSALPGITFTPPRTGTVEICSPSYASPNITAVAATLGIQLTDGTTAISESVQTGLVSTSYQGFLTCQPYNVTAGLSTTLKLQSKASSGQITIGGNGGHAVEWLMYYLDQTLPVPLFVNSVVSSYTGVILTDSARVTISNSAAAIVNQSGSWTVANGAGAGLSTVTFSPSFSSEPRCSCMLIGAATTSASGCWVTAISSSSLSVTRLRAGAAENGDVDIICTGVK